ncbi:Uncharacterised protein [Klebsiella pneumoniae]|nr:Uncharacterised protein [Klebsiella pneumoniae]
MRRLHTEEFHRRRDVSDRRAWNIAQARYLHLIALQRAAVFRHYHHHHFPPRFLQLGEEVIQVIKQLLRPHFVVCGFALSREVVAVMQRQGVIEGGVPRIAAGLFGLQPAVEDRQILIHRGAVKRLQADRQAGLVHQRTLHAAQRTQFFQEVAEQTVMAEHQLLVEAELRQVFKQVAIGAGRLIQVSMRQLAAAGAQQAHRRRAAVGGRGVKVFEDNIKVLP